MKRWGRGLAVALAPLLLGATWTGIKPYLMPGKVAVYSFAAADSTGFSSIWRHECGTLGYGFEDGAGGDATIQSCSDAACTVAENEAVLTADADGTFVPRYPWLRVERVATGAGTSQVFLRCGPNVAVAGVGGAGDEITVDGAAAASPVNLSSAAGVDPILCTGAGAPDASCLAAGDVVFVGSGGAGDSVSIDGVAATDPDLRSEGGVDMIRCTGAGAPDARCVAAEDVIADALNLNQVAGETDLRYDPTPELHYHDVDGGGTHATDGSEPFVDAEEVWTTEYLGGATTTCGLQEAITDVCTTVASDGAALYGGIVNVPSGVCSSGTNYITVPASCEVWIRGQGPGSRFGGSSGHPGTHLKTNLTGGGDFITFTGPNAHWRVSSMLIEVSNGSAGSEVFHVPADNDHWEIDHVYTVHAGSAVADGTVLAITDSQSFDVHHNRFEGLGVAISIAGTEGNGAGAIYRNRLRPAVGVAGATGTGLLISGNYPCVDLDVTSNIFESGNRGIDATNSVSHCFYKAARNYFEVTNDTGTYEDIRATGNNTFALVQNFFNPSGADAFHRTTQTGSGIDVFYGNEHRGPITMDAGTCHLYGVPLGAGSVSACGRATVDSRIETIAADWVNTANPWADNEVSDTLTASTSTTAAANDSDTSIATTAFVQQEIDDGDLLTDNCVLENDATPIPDSCVGNGTDDTGAGGGDSISVNGTAATDADFDDATPAAPSGGLNVVFQKDAGTPNNVSAHVLPWNLGNTDTELGVVSATPATDQNDYSPTGWNDTQPAKATVLRLDPSASVVITGLAGGTAGRVAWLQNVTDPAGADARLVILPAENASSTAANRFALPRRSAWFLMPGETVTFVYDGTDSRWRPLERLSWNEIFENYSDIPGANVAEAGGNSVTGTAASCQASTFLLGDATYVPTASIECDTGSTATGSAAIAGSGAQTNIVPEQGSVIFLSRVGVSALSTVATQDYELAIGFHDASGAAGAFNATDGVYWNYDVDTTTVWRACGEDATAQNCQSIGPTVTANVYVWLGIFINGDWTDVTYFYSSNGATWTIAGTLANDANIPDAAETTNYVPVSIFKETGTTASTVYLDLVGWRYDQIRGS